MKILTLIQILIFLTQHGFCQDNYIYKQADCEFINGKKVNCGDSKNKNGYWIYYKVGMTSHTDFVEDPSQYSEKKSYLFLISEGNYLNNKKIGNWINYSDYKGFNKQHVERIQFFDNLSEKDSLELEFFSNSTLKSKTFWNHGVKDSVIVFHQYGQIKFKAIFKNNKILEFWIYYLNGQLKYYGSNLNDFIIENLKRYDFDGQEIEIKENDISVIGILEEINGYIDQKY